jgi:predicted  nucleic acid-binding Zn-ribbon protein
MNLSDLLDLQRVDSEIDRLLEARASLPELELYRRAHVRTEAIRVDLTDRQRLLREIGLDLDRSNGELDIAEQKVVQQERRLFAGGLSAKETEHLRLDVLSLRRKVEESEDTVLELLQRKDSVDAEVGTIGSEFSKAEAEEHRLNEVISEQWRSIDAELARCERRKVEAASIVPQDLLDLYEDLRSRKGGVAVGRLDETGICGGCHLKLSAAERRQALQEDPPRCIHCRRILVP